MVVVMEVLWKGLLKKDSRMSVNVHNSSCNYQGKDINVWSHQVI